MTMRPTQPGYVSYSFGPGPLTPAVRLLVILNIAAYLLVLVVPSLSIWLGLVPALVFERWWFWQPVTYMFLHGGLFHLLFNMLALWMFGVELERRLGHAVLRALLLRLRRRRGGDHAAAVAAAVRVRRADVRVGDRRRVRRDLRPARSPTR